MASRSLHNCLAVFALLALLAACRPETGAEAFKAPERISAEATVKGWTVRLQASVPTTRVETFGFLIGEKGTASMTEVTETRRTEMEDALSFDATVRNLTPGKDYQWQAYAGAGESRITSEMLFFTLPEGLSENDPIPFEDPVFKQFLLDYDRDQDGEISVREAESLTEIRVTTDHITSLAGIEYMSHLTRLFCRYSSDYGRGGLTHLDLSGNPDLTFLDCSYNRLEELDLTVLPLLDDLHCNDNELEALDLTGNPLLRITCISNNHFRSLDLTKNVVMTDLHLDRNRIEELDLSRNVRLSVPDVELGPMTDGQGNNLLKRVYLPESRPDLAAVVPTDTECIFR